MYKKYQIISIIVPVYNVAPYLERCVDSLIAQTYPCMEIILIDDGSTDSSGEIADKLNQENSNIIVIHQENKGVSAARNAGLRYATGSYIGFVDPDDYVDKEMYARLYEKMLEYHAEIAACTFVNEYECEKGQTIKTGIDMVMTGEEAVAYDLFHGMYITCNKLFSRKACSNIFYDEQIVNGEDRIFDVMALMTADKVVYINVPYYHYYHRKNSAGTKRYTNKDFSLVVACKKIQQLVQGKSVKLEKITLSQLQHAYVQLLDMMQYDIKEYKSDAKSCVNELRKSFLSMLFNPYNSVKFKIKAILICISPIITGMLLKNIWRRS